MKSKAIKTGKISDWNSYKKLWNKVNNQKKTGGNKFHFTDKEKAECLNNLFASISGVDDQNTALTPFFRKSPNSLSNISCTAEEIELLVQTLNPNKANGLDGISNQMLRAVSKTISEPLAVLFNRSFSEGIFQKPGKWPGVSQFLKKGTKHCLQTIVKSHF